MKKVLVVLVVLVLALVVVVATRPGTFHIVRTGTMAAPPDVVYAELVDLHRWVGWSPWEKLDPQMQRTYSGPDSGVGASYHWAGNDKVGEGQMTITVAEPASKVGLRLEFLKPFASTSSTALDLAPDAAGTKVTWTMDGTNNFIAKAMCMVMDMDKMVGGDFERGLAQLKDVTEAEAKQRATSDSTGTSSSAPPPMAQ